MEPLLPSWNIIGLESDMSVNWISSVSCKEAKSVYSSILGLILSPLLWPPPPSIIIQKKLLPPPCLNGDTLPPYEKLKKLLGSWSILTLVILMSNRFIQHQSVLMNICEVFTVFSCNQNKYQTLCTHRSHVLKMFVQNLPWVISWVFLCTCYRNQYLMIGVYTQFKNFPEPLLNWRDIMRRFSKILKNWVNPLRYVFQHELYSLLLYQNWIQL